MDRRAILRSLFDVAGRGLEIGPLFSPIVSKRDGFDVEIADYTDAPSLRTLYGRPDIEHVDYVTGGRSVADVVRHRSHYDYIVASHVIEHQPDLIAFINDCHALLKPAGRLVLAVPDKTHSFDLYRPLSTVGQALQAHHERRDRHPAYLVYDHHAYAASRGGNNLWNTGYGYVSDFAYDLATARAAYAKAMNSPDYVDAHSWFFCASSFRLMMRDLHEQHAIVLREQAYVPGDGPEFYVSMSATAPGCPLSRTELQHATMDELRAIPN